MSGTVPTPPAGRTSDTLVVSSASAIVARMRGAPGPSLSIDSAGVSLGSPENAGVVAASTVELGGADLATMIAEASAGAGVDPAVPILNRQIRDGSIGLARLQPLPIDKGGTGETAFPRGRLLLAGKGGEFGGEGVVTVFTDPGLAWDESAEELLVGGILEVGGVKLSPADFF